MKKKKNFEGIEMFHFWENPPNPEMVRGVPSSKVVSGLFNPSLGLSELRFEMRRSDSLSPDNVTFRKKKGKEEETEKEEKIEEKKKAKYVKWNEEQTMALKNGIFACGEGIGRRLDLCIQY